MVALLPGEPVGQAGRSLVGLLKVDHPDSGFILVVDKQQRAADQLVGSEEGRLETEGADCFQSGEVKVLEMRDTNREQTSLLTLVLLERRKAARASETCLLEQVDL